MRSGWVKSSLLGNDWTAEAHLAPEGMVRVTWRTTREEEYTTDVDRTELLAAMAEDGGLDALLADLETPELDGTSVTLERDVSFDGSRTLRG